MKIVPSSAIMRADRQLDAAGDDDEGLADREQAEQADLVGGVGEVARQQEALVDQRHRRADDEDEEEEAEVFLLEHCRVPSVRPHADRELQDIVLAELGCDQGSR